MFDEKLWEAAQEIAKKEYEEEYGSWDDADKLEREDWAYSIYARLTEGVVYLNDITGTIGAWLDRDFDNEVPSEVVKLLQKAYEISVKEYETT